MIFNLTNNLILIPTALYITGDFTNEQFKGQPVNIDGLVFTVIYNGGITGNINPDVSSLSWDNSHLHQVLSIEYSANGTSVSGSKEATVLNYTYPTSLSISGDWEYPQYINSAIDYTGLVFTATLNDDTTVTVLPTSISPSNWGSTEGTQTATFSYTYHGVTVTATKSATVEYPYTKYLLERTIGVANV